MILLYAFSNRWTTNISRRTFAELQKLINNSQIVFKPVNSYTQEFYKKYIEGNSYSLIIGLGDGSKFSHKIQIETQAKNAYHDQPIYPFSPIFLDLNLPAVDIYDSSIFKISSNMGTYNCNYLAYLTQLYINQHSPATMHLFLHLPPGDNANFLAQKIAELLINNQLL